MLLSRQSISVTQLTTHIQHLFDTDDVLQDIWVSGEVSNMTRASSGHWYFTIKDDKAALRCVMWRSSTVNQTTIPQNGDAIEAHGSVSVYAARGEYQLYAELIRPLGMGDLYQEFERLKAKLADEGLFDAERKREYPAMPQRIGVVTSPTAAAFQDVLNVLSRRFPLAEVVLSPTLVQGNEAPPQIVRALQRLNDHTDVDVILLVRGGGSIEDLWPFNDENVARAVAASRIPVITGVGHETDFTIADFVSDARAPTPSAAAELATPNIADLRDGVNLALLRITGVMRDSLTSHRQDLNATRRALRHTSPQVFVRNSRQRVDDLNNRLLSGEKRLLSLLRERLRAREAALHAASPQALLERGYAIVTRSEDGKRVRSSHDAAPGTGITVQFAADELKARVEDKDTHERYKRTLF
jgi:exodeoxyribonuclease VII large subunit